MKKTIIIFFCLILSFTSAYAVKAMFYMLNGDQFEAELLTENFSFITPYSEIVLTSTDITQIVFPTPGNRITRIYTNMSGEKISGILLNDSFKIQTVGNELTILKDKVKKIVLDNESETPLKYTAEIVLRSGDYLFGMIEIEKVELETSYGMLNIAIKDIQNIEFEGLGNVISVVSLRKGNEMKGVIVNNYIPFQLMNDTKIEIVPDRIKRLSFKHRVFDEINTSVSGFESETFQSPVSVIKIDKFNKYAYAGYENGYIRTWDLQTGKLWQSFKAHDGVIRDIVVDSQAKYLVSGGQDGLIKIWDLNSEENLRTLSGHQNWIISLDLTSDGSVIVSGSRDKSIKLWDFNTGRLLQTIPNHTSTVMAVNIHPDDTFFLSTSIDQRCFWWDMRAFMENKGETINLFGSYQRKGDSSRSGIVTVDGKYAVAGFSDGEIIAWHVLDASKKLNRVGLETISRTLITTLQSFVVDNKSYIMAGNASSALNIYEIGGNKLEFIKDITVGSGLTSVFVTEDGQYIVKGFEDGKIKLEVFELEE
ncbi:MAG: WD40 repeat domain-containing protein [Thermotogota bacterium]|nr:WD40 repeat domain-containing protein [Thermotogota bacterium]